MDGYQWFLPVYEGPGGVSQERAARELEDAPQAQEERQERGRSPLDNWTDWERRRLKHLSDKRARRLADLLLVAPSASATAPGHAAPDRV